MAAEQQLFICHVCFFFLHNNCLSTKLRPQKSVVLQKFTKVDNPKILRNPHPVQEYDLLITVIPIYLATLPRAAM